LYFPSERSGGGKHGPASLFQSKLGFAHGKNKDYGQSAAPPRSLSEYSGESLPRT